MALDLCVCLTSSLAEEKARESESKARALELKLGDDLSKEARVRRTQFSPRTELWTIYQFVSIY